MKTTKKTLFTNALLVTIYVTVFCISTRAASVERSVNDLRSSDPVVRQDSMRFLGELKDKKSAQKVVDALKKEPSKDMQALLIQALGKAKNRLASQVLLAYVSDQDVTVRLNSVWALGEIGGSEAVPVLNECLKNEQNETVRVEIVKSLGKLQAGTESAGLIAPLLEAKNPVIIQVALETLSRLSNDAGIPYLIEAFKNKNLPRSIQAQSITLAKEMASESNQNKVIQAAFEHAYIAIPWRDTDVARLGAYLNHSNEKIRMLAYTVLCNIGFEKNWEQAKKGLSDTSPQVRQAVLEGAVSAGFAQIIQEVLPLYAQQEEGIRSLLLDVFRKFDSRDGLHQALADSSVGIQNKAALYLAHLGDASGLDVALQGLRSMDAEIMDIALETIEALKDEKALIPLQELYKKSKDKELKTRIKKLIENISKK